MTDVRTSSTLTRLTALATGCFIAAAGFLGTAHYAHAAALTSTSVVPASLTAGATSTATVSFTTVGDINPDGKVQVVFPTGFDVQAGHLGPINCSFTGGVTFGVSGQTITISRNGLGGTESAGAKSCTIGGVINPSVSGLTGTYTIGTYPFSGTVIDEDAAVTGSTIVAATLTSTNVEPASLVVGASGTTTVSFTTINSLAADDKIAVTFGSAYDVSAASSGACPSLTGGTISTGVSGQTVTLTRSAGDVKAPGAYSCTIAGIINRVAGSTGTYTISTMTTGSVIRDTNTAVTADTLTAADAAASVVRSTPVVGDTGGVATITLNIPRALVVGDKIAVTFPASYTVAQTVTTVAAGYITCSSGGASLTIAASGQILTLTVATSGTFTVGSSCQIQVNGYDVIPGYVDSTDITTFTIQTSSAQSIASDSTVALTDPTPGSLTSTNVEPGQLKARTKNTATVTFTTVNAIPSTGLIKVTFGSGFSVSAASGATCSSMGGSFATSVSGQTVTITRSGGASEGSAAESCTIGNIQNSGSSGSTGTYTIATAVSGGFVIDSDTAVTADSITAAASSSTSTSTAVTYDIAVSAPVATAAYSAGDDIGISWSTSASTGTVSAINLAYSTDGGITYTSIVSGTSNDGSYTWTAPSINATSVIVRAQATDLITVLATDTSDAFSIGSEDESDDDSSDDSADAEDTDTSSTSTTLLPTGTFMKGESWSTVYYVDGTTRRPFLDAQTFFTYADNFDAVIDTSDDYLANYTIGTPMMPKAGSVLVKVQSVNKVYALEADDTLRWITSESVASSLYGSNWADFVIDVPVTAWGHFNFGEDVDSDDDISLDGTEMETRDALNSK